MIRVLAHAHTTWSHDGSLSFDDWRGIASSRDIQMILLSEHEESGWSPERYQKYREACKRASDEQLVFVPGIEFNQDGFHVTCYGLSEYPQRPNQFDRLASAVHRQGCILILAHPAKYRWSYPPHILKNVDGIELWNSKWIYEGGLEPHPRTIALADGKILLTGQDVHKPKHVSGLYLLMPSVDVKGHLQRGEFKFERNGVAMDPTRFLTPGWRSFLQSLRTPLLRGALASYKGTRALCKQVRNFSVFICQRRIPFRMARILSRNPQDSLLWRVARWFYSKPASFFRFFGFFPLPLQSVFYKNCKYIDYQGVHELSPATVPKSIHAESDWACWTTNLPAHWKSPRLVSSHTVFVPKGFADSVGNVFTADGLLVVGAASALRSNLNDYYIPSRIHPPIYRGGRVATLTSSVQDNYYHWLMEVLPRIHMIHSQRLEPEKLFVQTKTAFQKETLSLLGVTDNQILSTDDYDLVRADDLVAPYHEIKAGTEHPSWVCDFLRRTYLPLAADEKMNFPVKRLYISREKARWRRVMDEPALVACLEQYGFQKVELEKLPFLDQVRLFHQAEVIIAPHGAALANIVFSQPGTKVIELQPWKLQDLFFSLSRSVGLDYYYLKSSTGPSDPTNNQQQLTIDLGLMRKTLQLAALE